MQRLTHRNPNPYEGESFYQFGTNLRCLGRDEEAYAAFYKSVWNQAWQAASYLELAELDVKKGEWEIRSIIVRAVVAHEFRESERPQFERDRPAENGQESEADQLLQETRAWISSILGTLSCQTEFAAAGKSNAF